MIEKSRESLCKEWSVIKKRGSTLRRAHNERSKVAVSLDLLLHRSEMYDLQFIADSADYRNGRLFADRAHPVHKHGAGGGALALLKGHDLHDLAQRQIPQVDAALRVGRGCKCLYLVSLMAILTTR